MAKNFPEYKAGQKIKSFDSSFLNALVALANAQPSPAPGGADTIPRPAGTVLVLNSTGADLDIGQPALVTQPAVASTVDEDIFSTNLILEAITPAASKGGFAVALQPIANGSVGRMCVAGLCVAKVSLTHISHAYCDFDSTSLASANAGSAQILWKAALYGTQWCVIRLGNRHELTVDSTDYIPKPHLSEKIIGDDEVGDDGWINTTVDLTSGYRKLLIEHVAPGEAQFDLVRLLSVSSTGEVSLREDTVKFDAARHFLEVTAGTTTSTLYMLPAGTAVGDTLRWDGTSWVKQAFQKKVGDMQISGTNLQVKYTQADGTLGAWETVTGWTGTECS